MRQKIIRIGTSAGIIIPKKELEKHNLKIGDEIDYILGLNQTDKSAKFTTEYDHFIKEYGETLKNLANR